MTADTAAEQSVKLIGLHSGRSTLAPGGAQALQIVAIGLGPDKFSRTLDTLWSIESQKNW